MGVDTEQYVSQAFNLVGEDGQKIGYGFCHKDLNSDCKLCFKLTSFSADSRVQKCVKRWAQEFAYKLWHLPNVFLDFHGQRA